MVSKNRKVDFLICGTQKGGTSALDEYLRAHHQICMADKKEVHFFDVETNFKNTTPDYSKYHSFFSPKKTHLTMGEATPIYMYWENAPTRIWQYNQSMKIIILLRNPIERAYSHWNMERSRNSEVLPFWDALINEQERCREALPFQHRVYSYIDRGFYLKQLMRIWTLFPRHQTLILKTENLQYHPDETLQKVVLFLGVDEYEYIQPKDVHSLPYQSSMGGKERKYLCSIYEKEIKELEGVLGWDCSDWLS